jgi:hypothetical protein
MFNQPDEPYTRPDERVLSDAETQELIEATATGLVPPCTIFTEKQGALFVTDVDAWEWHPHGIFATGKWAGTGKEVDVLIPTGQILSITYHFDALEQYHREQGAPDG